jgi:chaperone modulatory protein CbpM
LVQEGILDPRRDRPGHWRFSAASLQRARTAIRLQRDLDINLAGVALALQLLDEIDSLRARLRLLESSG